MSTTNTKAFDEFMARKARIDGILERLAERSSDHFGVNPNDVQWGHAGDLGLICEYLENALEAATPEAKEAA